MSAYSGIITCSNAGGATVRLNGSTGSKLATWDTGSGTMDLAVRNKSTSPYFFGALMGGSSSTLSGPIGGDGPAKGPATYQIGDNGLSTTFDGVIRNGSDVSQVLSIVKTGTGTLTLSGANTYTGTTTVSNGALQVNGSLSSSSTVTVAGGTLSGIGTIGGAATLNAGATLSAGSNSVGILTFSGNLTLNAASTNSFAVTSSGGVSNSVTVSGQLSPNGSLIKINSGTPLALGTYTLFNYSSVNGSAFNATPVFDVSPVASASIVDTGSGQINLVISSGPSGPGYITNSVSGNTLNLSWPTGQGWRLVSQTNNLLTGLDTNSAAWGTLPGASDGSAIITVDPAQPTVFYKLVYP
jgi:autotransporter-associated beta strand protein